jgi:hypothetical protein
MTAGGGTTYPTPAHSHTFAHVSGAQTSGPGSGGTAMLADATSATPTSDGTSATPASDATTATPTTDSTATAPTTDATAADIAETTNDFQAIGPTDAAGTALVIDEDVALPVGERGHKKHGHKRLHFIVWY